MEFLEKGSDLFTRIGDQDGVMFAGGIKGGVYFHEENYAAVISTLNPVLDYYRSVGDPYRVSETHRIIGLSYLHQEKVPEAAEHLENAVNQGREAGEPINLAEALIAYGGFHLKNKGYNEAQKVYLEAENLYTQAHHAQGTLRVAQALSKLHEESGDFKSAHLQIKRYLRLKDSLDHIANADLIQQLEAQYQNEKKQQQIELLQAQSQLKEEEQRTQRNIFITAILGAVLLLCVFYFLLKTKQKAHRKLKALDEFKSRFFANISHEFRTPLTLISGPIEHKLTNGNLEHCDKADFEMISRNSKQLLGLVDQLLDLSRLESGAYQLMVRKGDLFQLLKSLAASFEYAASKKDIRYDIAISAASTATWYDRDAIQKIVVNLLSNALKYTPEKGTVKFSAEVAEEKLLMVCENSGPGISANCQDKIFDRFYQQNGKAGGAGIGLALLKELTDLLAGEISVKSIPDQSTVFKVVLPIKKEGFPKKAIFEGENHSAFVAEIERAIPESQKAALEEDHSEEKPVLLIVEDNQDIIRFINNILSNSYNVLEADNGERGIEIARKYIPDIIVSDIMMPGVDGLELCRILKSDERTSHIPIIILTAKAGEESKLIGFETGADEYITKPFSSEVLKVRIKKLVEIRKNLQERFSQEVVLKPKTVPLTTTDQKFLDKVQVLLDEKLTDTNFNAETFAKDLGMSRMQLHRKLKGLTGLSANHFIRMYRIRLAADLLSNPGVNMAEICYMVGFNNPSYFSKCFKEFYHCTPSEFVEKLKKSPPLEEI